MKLCTSGLNKILSLAFLIIFFNNIFFPFSNAQFDVLKMWRCRFIIEINVFPLRILLFWIHPNGLLKSLCFLSKMTFRGSASNSPWIFALDIVCFEINHLLNLIFWLLLIVFTCHPLPIHIFSIYWRWWPKKKNPRHLNT